MSYYKKNVSKKVWLDNRDFLDKNGQKYKAHARCKSTYVKAPAPGRPFENTIPIDALLKKYYTPEKVKLFFKTRGNLFVNGNLVKDKKHPVSFFDTLKIRPRGNKSSSLLYEVLIKKNLKPQSKKQEIFLQEIKRNYLLTPILDWTLFKGKICVRTFQNKKVKFDLPEVALKKNAPSEDAEIFQKLRQPLCFIKWTLNWDNPKILVIKDKALDNLKQYNLKLIKLTGKDKGYWYDLVCIKKLGPELLLNFKLGESSFERRLLKKDFKKRYFVCVDPLITDFEL